MLNQTDHWYWCELLDSGREFRKFMENLTLSERSYLCDFLAKYIPGKSDEMWELAKKISRGERGLLLALCFKGKGDELTKIVEDKLLYYGVKNVTSN